NLQSRRRAGEAEIGAGIELHVGDDNPRDRSVEAHLRRFLQRVVVIVGPQFDVGGDILDHFAAKINVEDEIAVTALFFNASTSGTSSSVKLFGISASGAIRPSSTAPLPMPIGADGALTKGTSAAALSPPSFPHRLIFVRARVSPIPHKELDGAPVEPKV